MTSLHEIITDILVREGSAYTNRADDAGGPTKFGVTQRTLARHRGRPVTPADVAALNEREAREIYLGLYVEQPGFDSVLELSLQVGLEVIDTGVNCGTARAGQWLQRALNALNRGGRDYADVRVDGDVGPATRAALAAYLRRRGPGGETVLVRALNCLQGAFYIGLAETRASDEANLFGWLSNRVSC